MGTRRRRRKRLSAALARRRASWQSASNHGMVFLRLRRTVMNRQCWSSSLVSTSRYRWTRSSTDWSHSMSMSAHSLVMARSDAKASRYRTRHFLHVSHCSSTRSVLTLTVKWISAWSDSMPPTCTLEMSVAAVVITRSSMWLRLCVDSVTDASVRIRTSAAALASGRHVGHQLYRRGR